MTGVVKTQPKLVINRNVLFPFLSKTVSRNVKHGLLVSVRQEAKDIDFPVIIHELEIAIKRDIVFYEVEVTSITK